MASNGYGSGTLYQRKTGLWVGAIQLPPVSGKRARKTFAGMRRASVEAKMREWSSEHPRPASLPGTRTVHMRRARAIATHTEAEWADKVRRSGRICAYCKRPVGKVLHKDHIVPVSRGGSDGIDNLAVSCWDCNYEKMNMTDVEFFAHAAATGFFDKPRQRQAYINGRVRRVPATQDASYSRRRRRPKIITIDGVSYEEYDREIHG